MRIQPLIQTDLINVANWEQDPEYAVFPQGARAKDAFLAPDMPPDRAIIANKRYLFKRRRDPWK